jgi:hypothetical protein
MFRRTKLSTGLALAFGASPMLIGGEVLAQAQRVEHQEVDAEPWRRSR